MKRDREQLESLITRYLDDEAADQDRRALRNAVATDDEAAGLFAETAAVDREVAAALRAAMGRGPVRTRTVPLWAARPSLTRQLVRVTGMAAAAVLATVLWMTPPTRTSTPPVIGPNGAASAAGTASWFAPPPSWNDTLTAEPTEYVRPVERQQAVDRNWVVIPGKDPDEYLVIEVKRVRTEATPIQEDF